MTNIKISYRLHLLFILFFPIFTYILASIIQPQILNAENKINIIEESVKTEFPQGIRYKLEIDSANRIEELTQGSVNKANLMFSSSRKPWGFDGW